MCDLQTGNGPSIRSLPWIVHLKEYSDVSCSNSLKARHGRLVDALPWLPTLNQVAEEITDTEQGE